MKILLTGASSYVGARLYFDLSKSHDVTGTYSANPLSSKFVSLDVTSKEEVQRVLTDVKPDIVIHAANNPNAKWCEANPDRARLVNQESTQQIVNAAKTIGSKIIYISSFSARDISTVYGKTKFESELIVKHSDSEYLILRPSLILGYSPNTMNDRPFNRLLRNLEHKTPAIYDTSWKFQPTYVGHIIEVINMAIAKNIWNHTIGIAVAELKSRYDIAKDILTPFGITVTPKDDNDVTSVTTDDLSKLASLHLPEYTYTQIIAKIIEEIKNRRTFVLPE